MKAASIKKYLRPSTIMGRKSTFANAFASALAPHDVYSLDAVAEAMKDLEQDPDADLLCVYCGNPAATWDHVFNRVVNGEFSGHGHRIRNLVPCCRSCNERKGQKPWREFLEINNPSDKDLRVRQMENFLGSAATLPISTAEIRRNAEAELDLFLNVRTRIFELMAEADRLAAIIRQKASDQTKER